MLKQNTVISLEPRFHPKTKALTGHVLKIQGELLPSSEMEHHIVAAVLDACETSLESKQEGGKLVYEVTFTSSGNVLPAAQESFGLHCEAKDRGISVEDLKAEKASATSVE